MDLNEFVNEVLDRFSQEITDQVFLMAQDDHDLMQKCSVDCVTYDMLGSCFDKANSVMCWIFHKTGGLDARSNNKAIIDHGDGGIFLCVCRL